MQSLQSLQTLTNLLKICRLCVSCAFCDISVLKGFVVNNQVFDITLQLCNCKVAFMVFNFANFVKAWCNSGCFLRYRLLEGCWGEGVGNKDSNYRYNSSYRLWRGSWREICVVRKLKKVWKCGTKSVVFVWNVSLEFCKKW